jgi:hypothetical protein
MSLSKHEPGRNQAAPLMLSLSKHEPGQTSVSFAAGSILHNEK